MNKGLMFLKWTALALLFVVLLGGVTMMLWNWLVPDLFNGPTITFWQALGLLLLSKILLIGFNGKGNHKNHWKYKYARKFSSMSEEDRQRFKERMREKWCSRDWNTSTRKSDTSND